MAATLLGSLLVSLGLETGEFKSGLSSAEKELRGAQRRIEKAGKGMADLGKSMSLAVTAPLVALGVASVKAAQESQDAIGQVNAALKSMGGQAGKTSEQLQGMAEGLMKQSLFDDDEILRKVTANLLTFGNIAGDSFDKAQVAAVDLATRLGIDLQSATMMLGKALNDPVKGINSLKRSGIQFTEQQKEQIETMAAAGDMAGAQGVMLAELARQFGGAGQAARDANPWAVMTQSWNEFQEKVGAQLMKAMPAITGAITSLLEAFNSLSPGMQRAVVIGGALAAALGPVLVAVGSLTTIMAPFLAAIGKIAATQGILTAVSAGFTGLAATLAPIAIPLAAVAAAGALIYMNWDKIGPVLKEFWAQASAALGPALQELVSSVSSLFKELWNGPLGQGVRAAGKALLDFQAAYGKVMGPVLIAALKLVIDTFANLVKAISDGVRLVSAILNGDWKTALDAALSLANRVFLGIPELVEKMVRAIADFLGPKLKAAFAPALATIELVRSAFHGLYDAVVGHSYIPDMVDGIAAQMARLDAVMVDPVKRATSKATEAFRKMAAEIKPLMDRLWPEVARLNELRTDQGNLDKAVAGRLISKDVGRESQDRLQDQYFEGRRDSSGADAIADKWTQPMNAMSDLLTRFGETATVTVPKIDGLTLAFDSVGANLDDFRADLASAFTDVIMGAKSFGDAMRGVFNRLASKILDQMFNQLIGKALGAVFGVPGFAGGTNFAPGGPALVGEKGPEIVNLRRGTQVVPNHELAGLAKNDNSIVVNLSMQASGNPRADRESANQAAIALRTRLNPMRTM